MTSDDVGAAQQLAVAAGWNQLATDWRRILALEPECCFCVEEGGRAVATATAVCYGQRLAWVGMVLTHPEARRRGYARQAMRAVLAELDRRGVEASRLDATEMGQPLYEELGYRVECAVERWEGVNDLDPQPLDRGAPNLALDQEATGTDRGRLLELLAEEGCLRGLGGFAMRRAGRLASYAGPCVAESPDEARWLMERVIRADRGKIFWDLPVDNAAAVELARGLGFAPVRRLKRMKRGAAPQEQRRLIFALSGFETG